jgi:hypothetical protein
LSTSLATAVYNYLVAFVGTAPEGHVLHGAQVSKTSYAPVIGVKCIQIGRKDADLVPLEGGDECGEDDGKLTLIILRKVADRKDEEAFYEAREEAEAMGKAIALPIFNEPTLGGRVGDCLPGRLVSDWTTVQNHPHGLANLTLNQLTQTQMAEE